MPESKDNTPKAADGREIAYLEHPVSREDKIKTVREGKKIVDIRFAPDDIREKWLAEKAKAAKAKSGKSGKSAE